MTQAAGDVDKLTKAQDKGTKATEKSTAASKKQVQTVQELRGVYTDFIKDLEKSGREYEDTTFQLKRFTQEFDKMARSAPAGSELASEMNKAARAAERLSKEITEGVKARAKADRDRSEAEKKAARDSIALGIKTEADRIATIEAAAQRQVDIRRALADELVAETRRELEEEAKARAAFNKALDNGESAEKKKLLSIQQGRERAAAQREAEQAQKQKDHQAELDRIQKEKEASEKYDAGRAQRQRILQAEIAKTIRLQRQAKSQAERALADSKLSAQVAGLRQDGMSERDIRKTLTRSYTESSGEDQAITRRQRRIQDLARAQERLRDGGSGAQSGSWLTRFLKVDEDRLSVINNRIRDFEVNANRGGFSAVRFAGNLRGMVIVGAIAFFQQLVGVGISLGATLVSIASAALQAGAALGGALVAGAAQAIPVIGLLAAAWGRVGAVFDALKQQAKAQQTALDDGAAAADRQASANDALASAQEGLADAHRRVADAQKGLSDARFQAVRQIQDLIAAERAAQLQAESAVLAQADAQGALRRSIASGDVDSLASNALQVRSSAADVASSGTRSARARFDAARARRGGVEGMSIVEQAKSALADAVRGVAAAERGLAAAQRSAAGVTEAASATQKALNQLLAQLSPAERRLFAVLTRVQARYKAVFTGPGGVLESIINAFTYGAEKADELLQNNRLINSARLLAQGISKQLKRVFDGLSSPDTISFITEMARQARQNLPIVVDIFNNIAGLIKNIAIAAGPAFTKFLEFFREVTGDGVSASSGSGLERLTEFFLKGEEYAESIFKLTGAIAGLFLAIIGGSAEEGQNSIDSMTAKIREATEWINANQGQVQKFFRDARIATGYVMSAIGALARALFSLFHPDQVKSFSQAFENTLLPALTDTLKVMGALAKVFLDIAGTKAGGTLVRLALTSFLLLKTMRPVVTIFSRFFILLGELTGSLRLLGVGLNGLKIARGPIGVALATIAATMLVLSGNIDSVTEALEKLAPVLGGIIGMFLAKNGLAGGLSILRTALSKVPGLSKVAPAAAASTAGASGAAGAAGAAAGGAARTAFMTALKKAGWIGVGIAAGQGIVAGFKDNSVKTGIRDFASSISFGIIKTTERSAGEAAQRINNDLAAGSTKDPGKPGGGSTFTDILRGSKILAPAIPLLGLNDSDKEKLTEVQKAAVETITKLRAELDELPKNKSSKLFFDSFYDRLTDFAKTAPPEFSGAIKAMVDEAGEQKKRLDDMWKPERTARAIQTTFGLALQGEGANIKKVTDDLIEKIRPLPKETKKLAVRAAIDMAKGLEERGELPKGAAEKIRDNIVTAYDQMRSRAARRSVGTLKDTATAMGAIANVVAVQLGGMVSTVNTVLKGMGFGAIKIPTSITPKQATSGAETAGKVAGLLGGLLGGGRAAGGWIGKAGERGRDMIPAVLGRGEAVLNWGHQRLVEPALKAVYGFGLDGLFRRSDGRHGEEMRGGFARGGFVQGAAGTKIGDLAVGAGNLARQMFARGYNVTSAIRGNSTTNHSPGVRAALDFGDSVNNMRSLWRVLFPRRAQFAELGGPTSVSGGKWYRNGVGENIAGSDLQKGHEDHIHVAVLGRIRGAFSKVMNGLTGAADVAAETFERLTVPKVAGNGALSKIVRGLLGRVVRAGNSKMEGASGSSGGSGSSPSIGNGAAAEKVFRYFKGRGFTDAQAAAWVGNLTQESGLSPTIVNPRSGATGLAQWLGGRLSALKDFGGKNWKSFSKQLDFIWHELQGSEGAAYKAIKGSKGLAAAVNAIAYKFERMGANEVGDRMRPARAAYNRFAKKFSGGGPVAGAGNQDTEAALLTPGEHVWTAAEVARAGGHQVMYALRKMLGGGGQGMGNMLAKGGKAYSIPTRFDTSSSGVLDQAFAAQGIISGFKTSTINKKFTDALSKSLQSLLGDGGVLDQLSEATTRLTERLAVNLKRATFKITSTGQVIKKLSDAQIAEKAVENLRTTYEALTGERGAIQASLNDVGKRLKSKNLSSGERSYLTGIQRNLTKRQREVQAAIADNLEATYAAIEAQITAASDKANEKAGKANAILDLQDRVRNALGLSSSGQDGARRRGDIINDQIADLQRAAALARQAGRGDLSDAMLEQIEELKVTAVEAMAAGLNADIESVSRQAARRGAALDLRDRLATMREAAGDYRGAFSDRGGILRDKGTSLGTQRGDLANLLMSAMLQGNAGAVESLTDQIAELDVQIAENTAAIQSNTVQARQASINDITRRGGFLGGVYGGLQSIVTLLAEIGGTENVAGISALVRQQGTTLSQTGSGLIGELSTGYGVNLQGMSPQQIVSALSSLNYDAIEVGMTVEQRDQFEGLIQSIIDNTGAQLSNTQQLNQLTAASTSQSFTSTAWQWFRNAIFDGAGGLLPEYQNPSMGVPTSSMSGMYSPSGSTRSYVSSNGDRSTGSGDVFAPVINNEEKTVDMDAESLSQKLLFQFKNRPSS